MQISVGRCGLLRLGWAVKINDVDNHLRAVSKGLTNDALQCLAIVTRHVAYFSDNSLHNSILCHLSTRCHGVGDPC